MADDASPSTVEADSIPTDANANVEAPASNEEAVPVKVEQASSPPWVAEDDDDDIDVEMAEESAAPASAPAVTIKTEDGSAKDVLAATAAVKTEDTTPAVAVKTEETEKMAAIITDTVPVNLEDMFDDMDDDDEFSGKPTQEPLTTTSDLLSLKASDPEVMRSFYQRLFPWRYLFQWLNHSPTPTNDFAHREFAFTLQNDAYLRYQSFPTSDL